MWIQIAQLILSLSILIILHECGHFIPAKLFKTRVDKFYLFFDPWFSIFKYKKGGTEYGIGWLPLGGYVKIAGMIDESMDKEQMKKDPEPWEFRAKPTWQRLIIMLGGVTVNVILGVIIYAMVLFAWGESYVPPTGLTHGIYADSLAQSFGLKNGDIIYAVDGKKAKKFKDIAINVLLNEGKSFQVVRNGDSITVPIPTKTLDIMLKKKDFLISPAVLAVADSVVPNTPAAQSGLMKNDHIIAVNDVQTPYFQDLSKYLHNHKGEKALLTVIRNSNDTTQLKEVTIQKDGTLGFTQNSAEQLKTKHISYSFFAAMPAGLVHGWTTLVNYVKQFKLIAKAPGSIGGFGTIAKMYAPAWDWHRFWVFTAFLSIMLAVLNILPIPALDGGHVMFLLYEMISGKKAPEKVMEYAQVVGMIILLALVLYANGNDVVHYLLH